MALSRRRTISNSTPGPFFLGSTMRISLTALKSSPQQQQQQQQQTLYCEPAKQYYIHIYVCSSSKRGGLRISHVHKIGCLSLLESLQNRTKEATQKSSACGLPSLPPTISPLSILVVVVVLRIQYQSLCGKNITTIVCGLTSLGYNVTCFFNFKWRDLALERTQKE